MTFHIVLPRKLNDEEAAATDISAQRPRVAVAMLARRLAAVVHHPDGGGATGLDVLRAKLAGPPAMWALARQVAASVRPGDVIFCGSEAGGLQIAEACASKRIKLVTFVHNLDRPRGRAALKLFRVGSRTAMMLACSAHQTEFLRSYLSLPDAAARFIWDHTDTEFFAPGPTSRQKTRPMIVSVGLEQRDYQTLAAATHDMDIDVRISGFSEDAALLAQTFPAVMPGNMTRKFYSWPDLAQLYRDADLVVVSARENNYAAGVQSLMEAMASRRPIVATRTRGLSTYLDDAALLAVPPGDVSTMRKAIVATLKNPEASAYRAELAQRIALERHRIERYVTELETHLKSV